MQFLKSFGALIFGACLAVSATAAGTWTWQSNPPPILNNVFFLDGQKGWAVGALGTVVRTVDGGANWTPLHFNLTTKKLLSIFFLDDSTGWITGETGLILKTLNGGRTWEAQVSEKVTDVNAIRFIDRDTGIAVGVNLVIRTTNGGASWSNVGGAWVAFNKTFYGMHLRNDGRVWVVGTAWRRAIVTAHPHYWEEPTPSSGPVQRSVDFANQDTGWSVGDGGTIFKTVDAGSNWVTQTAGSDAGDFVSVRAVGTGGDSAVALNRNAALYKTTNGGIDWVKTSPGLGQSARRAGWIRNMDTAWAIDEFGGYSRTMNGGTAWLDQNFGLTGLQNLRSIFFVDTSTGWAAGEGGTVIKTTNGGALWSKLNSGTTKDLFSIHFKGSDTGYAVGATGSILKTVNGGAGWTAQSPSTTADLAGVHFLNGRTGWAVGSAGTILKTTDGGANWVSQTQGTAPFLSVNFFDANRGWITGDNGSLYKTTNAGASWTKVHLGNTNTYTGTQFLDSLNGWLVGRGTLLKTTDGGNNWTENPGFGRETIQFLDYRNGWGESHTTNGGATWVSPPDLPMEAPQGFPFVNPTGKKFFADINHGWLVGYRGSIMRYTDNSPPSPPVQLSPAHGVQNLPLTMEMRWTVSNTASVYHGQLSTDSLFVTKQLDDEAIAATHKTFGPLDAGKVYYWRVRARNSFGFGNWTETRKFTTEIPVPDAPTPSSPVANASSVAINGNLSWSVAPHAATYRVQLATDSGFANLTLNDSAVTATSRAYGPLSYNTVYYWRVNAKSAGGTSAYSTLRKFTTQLPPIPGAPVLATPAHLAAGVSLTPALAWNASAGASGYRLQLAADSSFASFLVHDSTLTTTPTQRGVGPLLPGVTYHWRVSAWNLGGASPFSAPWRFTTLALPDSVRTVFPALADTVKQDSVIARWRRANPSVTRYHLLTASDSGFTVGLALDSSLTDTAKALRGLGDNSAVWWKVRACNASGCAPYGPAAMFRVKLPPASLLGNGLAAIAVRGTDGAAVLFSLPERAQVRIRVLNAQGRELMEVLNEARESGRHRVALPKSLRASYILVDFRAGDYRKTLRILP